MSQNIRHRYDPATHIFYKYYQGKIDINTLMSSWENIISKKLIPVNTKRFLLDYSAGYFTGGPDATSEIASFYLKHDEIFGGAKVALIMQDPDQVIFPILVNEEQSRIRFRPFYTLECALEWLTEK